MKWQVKGQLATSAFREGRGLIVIVMMEDHTVMALESVVPKGAIGAFEALPQVLGDHAHKLVGKFPKLSRALAAAERFVKDWERGLSLEDCSCIKKGQL